MRILSIGNFGRGWDGSICDEEHIASALEALGHEVVRRQREASVTYNSLDDPYDFILIAQWGGYTLSTIPILKSYDCPIIYWPFDYQADGQEWHHRLATDCDLYLSKRLADGAQYQNWQWLSQDFAPQFLVDEYHQMRSEDKDIDVLFTGSYLPWAVDRIETLRAIDDHFNLTIHSVTPDQWRAEGFKNVQGPIMDHGLRELYSRSKVNISIDHTLEAGYWSDRNAQIMACGGMVLSRYVPLSETVFRDKIAYFYNERDCLEKIQYYLDNEFEREHLASTGYSYAKRELMASNRVKDLLTIVRSRL